MNARSKGRLKSEAQRGQALVLGLLLLAVAVASLAMLRGVGRVVEARMRLTHAADAAAYSGALAQARRLNLLAYANRTLVAHQVAMAHLVTLEASMAFTRTLAGQRRRNNPPVRLLATLFGRDVAAAYRVARAEPGTAAGLAQAYAEHDRVVHQVLAVGMASAVADLPATRARLMRLVLQDNHPTAPVPSIRMLSDGWPGYLERRDAMGHAGLRSAVEQAVQRYDFAGRRDGTRRNAVPAVAHCPRGHHTLRRRGATWLGADGRWGAVDTQSFHSLRFNRWAGCYLREYAMGWGAVLGDGSRAPSDLEHVENPPGGFHCTGLLALGTAVHHMGPARRHGHAAGQFLRGGAGRALAWPGFAGLLRAGPLLPDGAAAVCGGGQAGPQHGAKDGDHGRSVPAWRRCGIDGHERRRDVLRAATGSC